MKLLTNALPVVAAALLATSVQAQVVSPTSPTTPGTGGPVEIEVPVDTSERERLLTLLSGYHGLPEAARFEAALTDPSASLFALLAEPELNAIFYDRAVAALAYWPSDDVRALYDELLAEPGREMVRHRVMGHYAEAFGDDAVQAVAPYLRDGDLQLRLTAVSVLGALQTPAALQALDDARAWEQDALVLERLEQATRLR